MERTEDLLELKHYRSFRSQEAEPRREVSRGAVRNRAKEKTTTKKQAMRKMHVNEIRLKLVHTGEDRTHANVKKRQYRLKGVPEVRKQCSISKIKQKLLHKVAEER